MPSGRRIADLAALRIRMSQGARLRQVSRAPWPGAREQEQYIVEESDAQQVISTRLAIRAMRAKAIVALQTLEPDGSQLWVLVARGSSGGGASAGYAGGDAQESK